MATPLPTTLSLVTMAARMPTHPPRPVSRIGGAMSLPQLNFYRHDKHCRALITLAGEIDLETAPLAGASLRECLDDRMRTLDVDLTAVTFCDVSGLNAFLHASAEARRAGGTVRLHHPSPSLRRILTLTGCAFLLNGTPASRIGDPPAPPRSRPLSSAGAR